jgi:hypothetical protein
MYDRLQGEHTIVRDSAVAMLSLDGGSPHTGIDRPEPDDLPIGLRFGCRRSAFGIVSARQQRSNPKYPGRPLVEAGA